MKINQFLPSLLPTAFVVLLIGLTVVGCDPKPNADKANALQTYFAPADTGIQTGGVKIIPIKTPKGTFNVWTKRIGNNPTVKVLILHGGPGAGHEAYEVFESFLPKEGIEFIYYDQLGAGNSDRPTDKSLWVLPRFVEEVEQVRTALGLNKDNLYLYGQSWGGILGIEYALKYGQNIKGLIISNMMSSAPAYSQYANDVLAKQMDPKVLAEIKTLEAKGDFTNPRYMELLLPNYYEKHICRFPTAQWPEPLNRGLAKLNQEQYVTMQGPSEFGMAGDANLKNWDRSKDLPKITVPTLVIGATYDTMDPKHMAMMARQVKNGTFLLCTNGSHLAMYDDQQTYFTGLISFLKKGN
ncbi:proline iminopeptidase-family hydrolase [Larkinella rosea]|uniref:Alpha/beta fold hydrolase n=1 Tax=Larkinella rosea TaxID=2025312 RepID=A0A3P1C305_9BACT|nr:proline iminopeptidase-family hydrolase [Larkinella rosea]RRB07652.1 alpha/beta fold hydrolase [Larkinella rosea]